MTTKQVTVTKYISCDGQEFDTQAECVAHERETRKFLEDKLYEFRCKKLALLEAINDSRINARILHLEIQKQKLKTRNDIGKSEYYKQLSTYWRFVSEYNTRRRTLSTLRRGIRDITNDLYKWFGRCKKKSSIARLERKEKSLRWRQENAPDKWRTPNKIRVSKLQQKEEQQ